MKNYYEIAKQEHGTKEIVGSKHNSKIVEYHQATNLKAKDDETAWCSSFVNWCLKEAGLAYTKSAAAISFEKYGIKVTKNNVQQGDIVVFKRGAGKNASWQRHVGFFAGQRRNINGQDQILILGGNQSNKVSYQWYSTKRITALRRPEGQEITSTITNLKPLWQSKTLAGGTIGLTAIIVNGIADFLTSQAIVEIIQSNSPLAAIVGITLTIFSRVNDRIKGRN